jgi:arylsulfatase A-like enzyme
VDSISFAPTLLGKAGVQRQHEFLYWEFHEGGFKQAVLYQGRWKGIRAGGPDAPLTLFDQQNDLAEQIDVAAQHPEIVEKIAAYLKNARTPTPDWPPIWRTPRKTKK